MKKLLLVLSFVPMLVGAQPNQGGGPFTTSQNPTGDGAALTNIYPSVRVFPNRVVIGPNGKISTAGTTTAGIQEAINSLTQTNGASSTWGINSGGGRVIIAKGIYNCTNQIVIPDNGPYNLILEGEGKVNTICRYFGSTNFVQNVGVNLFSGFNPLNLVVKNMGFTYVYDTNKAAIFSLNLNEAYFENVLWYPDQVLTKLGLGTSLIHFPGSPTNAIGTVGMQIDSANIVSLFQCEIVGCPYGIVPLSLGTDQMRIKDCFFGEIRTNKTLYAANLWVGLYSLPPACAIYGFGTDIMVEDCHFNDVDIPVVSGSSSLYVVRPRYESVNYTAMVDSGQAGSIFLDMPTGVTIPNDAQIDGSLNITLNPVGTIVSIFRFIGASPYQIYSSGNGAFQSVTNFPLSTAFLGDGYFTGSLKAPQFVGAYPTNTANLKFTPTLPGQWITALATRTTNTAQRATLEVDIGFVDAATGTPVGLVTVEQGTQKTNVWTIAAPGTIVSTVTNHYSFKLTPSAVVTVTDVSRGTGASVTLSQSQLTSE